jgi:hypothetical protein
MELSLYLSLKKIENCNYIKTVSVRFCQHLKLIVMVPISPSLLKRRVGKSSAIMVCPAWVKNPSS